MDIHIYIPAEIVWMALGGVLTLGCSYVLGVLILWWGDRNT